MLSADVSLQLDVDLATAPRPGAVQLELWHGLNILASAPLLLLPPLLPAPDHHQSDLLLEELKQHVTQHSWGEGKAGNTSGVPALLSDMGQLLFTADGISNASQPCAAAAGVPSWGGVGPAVIRHHSQDPALLGCCLNMAEGLLEYAQSTGLLHTAQAVEAACKHISNVVKDCSATNTSQRAEQPNLQGVQATRARVPQSKQPTFKECVQAAVYGFKPKSKEESYTMWAAQQCAPLIFVWKPLFHVLMAASMIGSIRRGDPFSLSDLPIHLLLCSPHALALGLAAAGHYR
jgi:hypothetical protein